MSSRSDNMKRVRAEYYEKYDEATRQAWRVKGGKNNANRHKYDSEKAKLAARKRWHGEKKDEVSKP